MPAIGKPQVIFDEAIAQNATLQHHDLNLDRLYFGARRATAVEMAQLFKADFQFASLLEHKTAKGDRLAELLEVSAVGAAVLPIFTRLTSGG